MTRSDMPDAAQFPRRRRGWSRTQKLIVALLAAAVLAVFAFAGWVMATTAKIDRIPAAELTALTPVTPETGPRTFLVVGSDSRDNLPDDFDGNFGDFGGARADVIMLAKLVPGERIQLLSLPRDLKVDIPGHGTNKLNAAFAFGGPDLLVQTVQAMTGVEVNHYIEVDFAGFAEIVDALGGVTMEFPYPARDLKSGLAVDAGTQRLDGAMALAFVRSRHYQEFRNGEWVSVGGSDIGRTRRQQELLVRLFDQVTSRSNAFNLPGFVSTVAEHLRTDEGLTTGVMIDLGREALRLRSDDIERATLPVRDLQEGGIWYVVPVEPDASAYLDAFRQGIPFPD